MVRVGDLGGSPAGQQHKRPSLLRSAPMCMVQMIVQHDAAAATVEALGEVGSIMFVDLNEGVTTFQRNFVNEVKTCDKMERDLAHIRAAMASAGFRAAAEGPPLPQHLSMEELQRTLEENAGDLRELKENQATLVANYNHLVELSHVLQKCGAIFSEAVGADPGYRVDAELRPPSSSSGAIDLLEDGGMGEGGKLGFDAHGRLGYVTGVLERTRLQSFERALFRATRGNIYMRTEDILQQVRDPRSDELIFKSVFIVFFSGTRTQDKVAKIADAFGANRYNYPAKYATRQQLLAEVQTRIDDLQHVIQTTVQHRNDKLRTLARQVVAWRSFVMKRKAVYRILNMWNYDITRKCLIAEGWCPMSLFEQTQRAARTGAAVSGAQVPSIVNVIDTDETPPSYFSTNKYTAAFQAIIDGYGVPRYGEMNPAAFTIITYPFLFGVMFGDVGHGLLILIFALYFICNEKKFYAMGDAAIGDVLGYPWHGRYVLLLMSLFAVYCGLIYNDTFGLMADLFGSAYETASEGEPRARKASSAVYAFGLDPAWHSTSNELSYSNSYKMKLSIILGVLQMNMGLFCSLLNALHFRNAIDVWCEFVPQAIFMLSIFGYLCFTIFLKWSIDWVAIGEPAPSLITMLIDFFMKPGVIKEPLYAGQAYVQSYLLTVAFISLPWMLLAKPLMLRRQYLQVSGYKTVKREDTDGSTRRLMDDASSDVSDKNGKYHEEEFEFSEVMMHQMIHTIEYALGCISNTASYLRLWALSLAHKQLSAVFYNMILKGGLKQCGADSSAVLCSLAVFCAFAVWSACTVGILCCMELLSAFLHALRLHWVEFQSKFYHGDGRKFVPFSFHTELERSEN
ncbi:hypothetical protein AB1Y20_007577 [Prymnesium parvum]|uniref:V-type proton ATPase subunit a n=1 Tax=Prymnesium parvum TaxID=97485 RepID=A0AB34IVV4_PRYPA